MLSRTRFALLLLLAATLVTFSVVPVFAQELGSEGSNLRKAQAYLTLAGDLFRSKDYDGALKELQRAEPLVLGSEVHPLVRFNIARCFEELGRASEAYQAYGKYLELKDEADARRKKARAAIERLRAAAFGTLRIGCAQNGTTLVIPALGEAPYPCPFENTAVLAGEYVLAAALRGYEGKTQTVNVRGGQVTEATFRLVPKSPALVPSAAPAPHSVNWAWVGSGIGVGAVGVAFHVMAFTALREHNQTTVKDVAARDEILSEYHTQRAITYTAYAVSAALIGYGYYLSTQSRESGSGVAITAGPTGVRVEF